MQRDAPYRSGFEVIDQPLYDVQTYPHSGAERMVFFRDPIGIDGRSLDETNMELGSHLPAGVEHLITGIGLIESKSQPNTDRDRDRMRMLWNGALQLIVGSRVYLTLPLVKFYDSPYVLDAATRILLVSQMNFAVELRWAHPAVLSLPYRVGVELKGYRYRRSM